MQGTGYLASFTGCCNKLTQACWIKTTKFFQSSGSQKSEVRVSAGLHALQQLRGESIPDLFQSLVAASIPWLAAASLQAWPLSSHCLLFSLCVLSLSASLLQGNLWGHLGSIRIIWDNLRISKSLIYSHLQKLPYKVIFTGSRGLIFFGSHHSAHYTIPWKPLNLTKKQYIPFIYLYLLLIAYYCLIILQVLLEVKDSCRIAGITSLNSDN